jgi:hypothetical protein
MLPPSDHLPNTCNCGQPFHNYFHLLCCKHVKSAGVTLRHDIVLHTLASIANRAGFTTTIEPRRFDYDQRLKPDLLLTSASQSIMVDVVVTHPCRTSNPSLSIPRSATAERERQKQNKYNNLAHSEGASFFPFAVEAHGAFGDKASALLDTIAQLAYDNGRTSSTSAFLSWSINCLSVAIQAGVAKHLNVACISNKVRTAPSDRVLRPRPISENSAYNLAIGSS